MLVNADGSSWEVAAQDSKVNRAGANPVHSVSTVPLKLRSLDVYHRRAFAGVDLRAGFGYEDRESAVAGESSSDLRAFVDWTWRVQ